MQEIRPAQCQLLKYFLKDCSFHHNNLEVAFLSQAGSFLTRAPYQFSKKQWRNTTTEGALVSTRCPVVCRCRHEFHILVEWNLNRMKQDLSEASSFRATVPSHIFLQRINSRTGSLIFCTASLSHQIDKRILFAVLWFCLVPVLQQTCSFFHSFCNICQVIQSSLLPFHPPPSHLLPSSLLIPHSPSSFHPSLYPATSSPPPHSPHLPSRAPRMPCLQDALVSWVYCLHYRGCSCTPRGCRPSWDSRAGGADRPPLRCDEGPQTRRRLNTTQQTTRKDGTERKVILFPWVNGKPSSASLLKHWKRFAFPLRIRKCSFIAVLQHAERFVALH